MKEEDLLFGKIVLNNRLATEDVVRHCLQVQEEYRQMGQGKPIGEIFVEEGYLTREQAQKVLDAQKLSIVLRDDNLYGKLAVKNGLVTPDQVKECLKLQKSNRYDKRIGQIMLDRGYLNEKQHRALLNAQKRILKVRDTKQDFSGLTDIIKKPEVAKVTKDLPQKKKEPTPQNNHPSSQVESQENSSAPPLPEAAPTSGTHTSTVRTETTSGASYEDSFLQKALELDIVTREQIEECKNIQEKMLEMGIEKSLDQILIDKKYIDTSNLKKLQDMLPIKSPIESYECEKKLGEGAMGTVYKANLKGDDKIVALKVMNPDFSEDTEYLRRFIREAQAAIELKHPNIVQAYEVGVAGDYYYYSMEYVEGFAVRELLDEGPLMERKVVEYAIQIAKALEFAAEHHIVHRDIKPENIMIDKHSGEAKLCDLGIAKRLDQDMALTQPGMAVGTPYYIPPEQAKGGDVDTRSDIYALGATLFHMVTGNVPYDGESPTQILIAHVTDEIPKASEVKEGVSEKFSRILIKMMAKNPEDRYQTPSQLLAALQELQISLERKAEKSAQNEDESDSFEQVDPFDESQTQSQQIQSPIESYEVEKVLGQGAMGIVYKGNAVGDDRPLAIKVLLPQVAEDKEFLRRFILEAQASMDFDHPNIVKAFDVGISGDYYYYSMEYVEGQSVKDLMDDQGGRLKEPLALDITHQITEALCYAHSKSVVHRDIKPENIMFTNQGVAKLCDLGIAKQLSNDKGLTQPGMAVGSPYYIAPEQARGAQVDSRTDIYSLGASLFHMLTGQVPFEGHTAAAVMAKHVRDPVPNPLDRNPTLSSDLGDLIMKMMQKKADHRFDTPMALRDALEGIMNSRG